MSNVDFHSYSLSLHFIYICVEQVYEYILLFLSKYTGILIDLITSTSTYCTVHRLRSFTSSLSKTR